MSCEPVVLTLGAMAWVVLLGVLLFGRKGFLAGMGISLLLLLLR